MMEQCCVCGKEAILDKEGKCFDCAEVTGKKLYKVGKSVLSESKAALLFFIFSVINILGTCYLFIECHGIDELIIIVYVVFAGFFTCSEVVLSWEMDDWYPCWEKPIVLFAAKYLAAFVYFFPKDEVAPGTQSLKMIFCFFIVWIVVQFLGLVFSFAYDRGKILKENKEQTEMISRFSGMPKVTQKFQFISDEALLEKLQAEEESTVDMVRHTEWENDIKEKVIQLIRSREDELRMINEVKLYYCRAIEWRMNDAFRKFQNGDWVNEIRYDIANGFQVVEEFPKSTYVTRELFELWQMTREELTEPWKYFQRWEEGLAISQSFSEFRGECISVTLGETGEQKVARELQPYEGQILVLPNLRLEVEGESIENDFVVVSPYGIYVLEVKNLGSGGGYGLYIEKDGRWNKMRGNRSEPMESPVHQNERHILYLEKYINAELGRKLDDYLRVQGIVVIANDMVDIRNDSDHLILRYNNVMSTIRKLPVIMKEEDMKRIAEILSKAGLEPKKYPMKNYFDSYAHAKIFTEEYLRWKESTKELKEYVDRYRWEHMFV